MEVGRSIPRYLKKKRKVMEVAFFSLGLLVGNLLGWIVARVLAKKGKSIQEEHLNRLNQEAWSLTERIKNSEAERLRFQEKLAIAEVDGLNLNRKVSFLEAKLSGAELREGELVNERKALAVQVEEQRRLVLDLSQKLATAKSSQSSLEERLQSQAQFMDEFKKQTKSEFENLAQQILDHKSKTLSEQTQKNLEVLLNPLKEKISSFEKKVDDSYHSEAKERFALKGEVEKLILLNEKMTKETNHLTQALKGDSKFQGDWGELVLERILEASGLREGFEYFLQSEHEDHEGGKFKPDVVVHLPESKHIIIDSKVSLKAYELYCRCEDAGERQAHLVAHLKSIQKHMDELSEKHYSKLKGIHSPEFVFLFMPIEPAYLLAVQSDTDLSMKAWKKNVALVTSTTLFTSLKTVASIWRLENQNKNAMEIAKEGAKLYDKFSGFLEDFEKIGKTFETGQIQFSSAMGKLKDGPGNVFRKMELLRELGAAPNKRIRQELLD